MANRKEGDWQEEIYQKIKSMKEKYLPDLKEMYKASEDKLQHEYSLPPQQRLSSSEKMKQMTATLDQMIQFLNIKKKGIVMPGLKGMLDTYEKQMIDLIKAHKHSKNKNKNVQPKC